jgi:CPA1 family monovalent cation:H+ antiporter
MSSILEGESLLNDASSLIIFRFALIALTTGHFLWYQAALDFSWMLAGGIGVGLITGLIFMKVHQLLPTDVNMDIVLTIVTPYVMYIVAEELHSSGVLAVVSGGLFLSNRRHHFLNSSSRLRGNNFWESFVFVLNGLVFLLIGLDLPEIITGLQQEGIPVSSAIGYGLLVTVVLIVVRMLSAYGAVVVTLIARNFIHVADPNPGFKAPVLLGWTGMRGVVSLAAALSVPVQLSDGTAFPHRNLILFITFIVILTTLLVQGLTLPFLIRKITFPEYSDYLPEEEADLFVQKQLATNALQHLNDRYSVQLADHPFLQQLAAKWHSARNEQADPVISAESKSIYLDVLDRQRQWLLSKEADAVLDEQIIRKYLTRIDLEEEKLRLV